MLQGCVDGVLSIAISKIGTQPQIYGAYKRDALVRSKDSVMEVCAALQELEVMSLTSLKAQLSDLMCSL